MGRYKGDLGRYRGRLQLGGETRTLATRTRGLVRRRLLRYRVGVRVGVRVRVRVRVRVGVGVRVRVRVRVDVRVRFRTLVPSVRPPSRGTLPKPRPMQTTPHHRPPLRRRVPEEDLQGHVRRAGRAAPVDLSSHLFEIGSDIFKEGGVFRR